MNYKELSKVLHDELDALLVSIEGSGPPDGIVDLELIFTAALDGVVTTTVATSEFVELVDKTWVIESSDLKIETYDTDTLVKVK